jgi:hypothetical protein
VYCIHTKSPAWHAHSGQVDGRQRPKLGRILHRLCHTPGVLWRRLSDYGRFAGLARLASTGVQICCSGGAETGEPEKETRTADPTPRESVTVNG